MSSKSKYKLYQIYTSTDNINWVATDMYEADLLEECSFDCGCEPIITARTYSIVPSEQTVNVDCDVYKYTFEWTINETDYWNNGDITTTSFTTSETVKIGINITDEDKTHTGVYTYEDATANWTIIQRALDPCFTVVKLLDEYEEHEDYIRIYNIDTIPSSWGRDYQTPNTIVEMVKIGNCVTEIDSNAFKYWTELTSVTIPDSVTSIGGGAFNNCYKLNSVEIPNSVTYLGNSVFSLCSGLTSVVLPTSIDYVPFDCFYDCFNLTSITIPNNYTSIRGEAFAGCWNLSSITLSENIEVIYDNAFEACKSITSLTLPNSVREIGFPTIGGSAVFGNCDILKELTIPSGVSQFNTSNVSNCPSLSSITFNNPDGIDMTGDTFDNIGYYGVLRVNDCAKYSSVLYKLREYFWECNVEPIRPTGDTIVYFSDGTSDSYYFNRIPEAFTNRYSFDKKQTITSVEIGNAVVEIGLGAFEDCRNLTSVTLSDNVQRIGASAFSYCGKLKSVTLPSNLTCVLNYAFFNAVTDVYYKGSSDGFLNLSRGVNSPFQDNANIHCTNATLKYSEFPKGKVSFESDCPCITGSSIVPTYITYNNGTVEQYELGEIPSDFISSTQKTNVVSIQFGGVVTINSNAFNGCWNLTSVTFTQDVLNEIGEGAFANCAFSSITIPSSVRTIGKNAFLDCEELLTVNIKDGVQYIGESAFNSCGKLVNVRIGSSVKEIGKNAFYTDRHLQYVEVWATEPPKLYENVFPNSTFGPVEFNAIYVIPEYVDTYKNDSYWSIYNNIIKPIV